MLLTVKDLDVYYGVIHAIKKISFDVNEGEIVALIGANGAGKSSIMKALSGIITSGKDGQITFDNQDISHMRAHKIVESGLAQVPEGRRIFAEMTVLENLEMGAFTRNDKKGIEEDIQMVYKLFPRLEERKKQLAGTLSGGEQQMLAMGRALMSQPKLLLLDEPSMGLSPILVNEIFNIIQNVNKNGTTILLVEQNANKALSIADRAYVLETGKITISGPAKEVANNPKVKEAYLG